MIIEKNISLKQFNTFGIDVDAKLFGQFSTVDDISEALSSHANEELLILGGGSNILFTRDLDGLALKNNITGKEIIEREQDHCYLRVGGGENWHECVLYCIENGLAGIENLSLIPGNCGAAPMQNIGAYGVEIKEVFQELEAFHIPTQEVHIFKTSDCKFGYRESVFKNKLKGEYIILNVTFKLNNKPSFNISYGSIKNELEKMEVSDLSIRSISEAVIAIRQRKLPDPKKIGNAGSFFKNPVVSEKMLEKIRVEHPNVVSYPTENGNFKLAAGWLIDKAGWKGRTFNNYGVHKDQALVLVNYGDAKGNEIYDLSEEILISIKEKFAVDLEREVNIH